MSLPSFVREQFTMEKLPDSVVNIALDRCDYPVSTETAKRACYQMLSHSATWNDELEQFRKELHQNREHEHIDALDAVMILSAEITGVLADEDVLGYKEAYVEEKKVTTAMKKLGHKDGPGDTVAILVAAYMVKGAFSLEDDYKPLLEACQLTTADIKTIAELL